MTESASKPSDAKIACDNLWKVYGHDPAGFLRRHGGQPDKEAFRKEGYIGAVRGLSFAAQPGEILVIMGLSGSGKSTLIRCLSRLIDPTAGVITFEGRDITKASEAELIELRRRKFGMVFQHFGLLPHRTVLRNVSFPLEIQGVDQKKAFETAQRLIELVGLSGRENYFPKELSGGQQQRVGIARSLAVDPDLWFLDEPFSALDPLIRREMQDEFLRLQRMLKKTIVFITHDFDEAVRVANRIGIMNEGALVQLGTPEEIVTAPVNDYVAAFTRTAPRGKLISLGSIMLPLGAVAPDMRGLAASTSVEQAAPQVIASDVATIVLDDAGAPVGAITRERLVEVLFQQEAAS